MRDTTIARNYAEAFLTLAQKAKDPAGWGKTLGDVANAVRTDVTLRRFLESPKVSVDQKNDILGRALQDRAPRLLVKFIQTLVRNRRQMLLPIISTEYYALLDETEGRVHAEVTVATETSDAETKKIAAALKKTFGKEVVPHVRIDPAILGGVIVKIGDTVMDGSVRRRLSTLRRRLMYGQG
jgi:F-type H+-transporting ATPase subunit delta